MKIINMFQITRIIACYRYGPRTPRTTIKVVVLNTARDGQNHHMLMILKSK